MLPLILNEIAAGSGSREASKYFYAEIGPEKLFSQYAM